MALRVASRRLGLGRRALPPALGMMHQEVGPNLFLGEKVLLLKGFSPRFTAVPHGYAKSGFHSRFSSLSMRIHNCSISSATPCNTQNKAKVLIDCASRSGFIPSRAMSTSSRPSAPPPEEYWFEIVGHRTQSTHSRNNRIYRKRISGVPKDKAEAMFRNFLWKIKNNGQVIPNGVPGLPMYQRVVLSYGKVKLLVQERVSILKTRYLLKFLGLEVLVLCVFLYGYFGRPLSLIRRVWKLLKATEAQKEPEE